MASKSIRIFVCSPHQEFVDHVTNALKGVDRFRVAGNIDPRALRPLAKTGVDVIIIHERFHDPPAEQLAGALLRLLPETAILLMTDATRPLPEGTRFHGTFKYPIGPPILQDKMVRAAASMRQRDTRSVEAEVELRFARLGRHTHYQTLGVSPSDGADSITQAYDRLSLILHPDRSPADADSAFVERMTEVYVAIGEAYRVLRSRVTRRQYDASLEAPPQPNGMTGPAITANTGPQTLTDLSNVRAAQKSLRTAQHALAAQDYQMALLQAEFALSLDSGNTLLTERVAEIREKAEKKR